VSGAQIPLPLIHPMRLISSGSARGRKSKPGWWRRPDFNSAWR